MVPSRRRTPLALAPAALALLALAGGGGAARTADATRTATVVKTVTAPGSTAPASTTATAMAPARTTPSAPNPNAPLPLHAAEQVLSARGYATLSERDWRPGQPLKVLIGVGLHDPAGVRRELAFFFVGASFIGTDTKD